MQKDGSHKFSSTCNHHNQSCNIEKLTTHATCQLFINVQRFHWMTLSYSIQVNIVVSILVTLLLSPQSSIRVCNGSCEAHFQVHQCCSQIQQPQNNFTLQIQHCKNVCNNYTTILHKTKQESQQNFHQGDPFDTKVLHH